MNRRQIREAALCMIFDYSFHTDSDTSEQLDLYLENFQDKDTKNISDELRQDDYFTKAYFGVVSNIDELDEIIASCSKKWSSKRISRVSKSILRLALYEIIYMKDIPCQVSVNEAVELAKKFDSEESYTFVNGILGAYLRSKDVCSASEE
ncbi:MAG: transcription antitermination factor NusB [Clostridia bacterium]|nr:transcription antitermination factor NusB [Clostridia bacterium]